jgi:predicted DNA-binding ribbon-helix-helix protein
MKRSVTIVGHRTSVSLEEEFWEALCDIAREDELSVNVLVSTIDKGRNTNLSSAIRLFVLDRYRTQKL